VGDPGDPQAPLQIEGCKPFEILNLGNYERHKLAANGHWERYVQFILQLYRAEPVTGFKTLHGKKARAYVHVGSVDSPSPCGRSARP
jgi:adenine-specific DNA-methyltransferase